MNAAALDPRRWKALALAGATFLMTVLDLSIVNVALPSIGQSLEFSAENLQWIITAYALTYGGLLLLGGRAADLLGRRLVFMVGVAIFTAASLLCGLASSDVFLVGMRGIQGVGAALVASAALAIVTTAFPEGAERNKALAIWGALGGSGAAIGVLLGGVLTNALGWEWIFFVNVPVGAMVLAATPFVIRETRSVDASRGFDPLGALAITGSMVLLVYAISTGAEAGWGTGRTIGLLAAAAVLLVLFLFVEARVRAALVPLRIFRLRTVVGANVVGMLLGSMIFSMYFLLTIYVQEVLGYSVLKTGIAFLAAAGTGIAGAGMAQALIGRLGPKVVMSIGMLLFGGGLLYFTQIDVGGSFTGDLLVGCLMAGFGIGFAFVPVSIVALAHVEERDAGLASGLINTSQNIGGAIGVAVAATLFTTQTAHELPKLLAAGTPPEVAGPTAMVSGFHLAYLVLAIVAVAGLAASLLLLRGVTVGPEAVPQATQATCGFAPNGAAAAQLSTIVLAREPAQTGSGEPPLRRRVSPVYEGQAL